MNFYRSITLCSACSQDLRKANKWCLDCKGTGSNVTTAQMNFGTFICTPCGIVHREFMWKTKTFAASTFIAAEVAFLQSHGNEVCRTQLCPNPLKAKAHPASLPPSPCDPGCARNLARPSRCQRGTAARREARSPWG